MLPKDSPFCEQLAGVMSRINTDPNNFYGFMCAWSDGNPVCSFADNPNFPQEIDFSYTWISEEVGVASNPNCRLRR